MIIYKIFGGQTLAFCGRVLALKNHIFMGPICRHFFQRAKDEAGMRHLKQLSKIYDFLENTKQAEAEV